MPFGNLENDRFRGSFENILLGGILVIARSMKLALTAMVAVALFAVASVGHAGEDPYAKLGKVKWKVSQSQAPDNFMNKAYEKFAAYVGEKSGGKFTIEVYHSGMLGAEQEVIENMQMGTIAGNLAAPNLLANFVPCYNLFALPALFKDEKQLEQFLEDTALGGKMAKACEEKDLINYGYFQTFFSQLYTKRKVEKVADLTGMKIRVMGNPIFVNTYQALGCNATTTPWTELYTALQLGVCEGMDHVAASVKASAFYENLKFVCEPKLLPSPMFVLISKPMFDRLPKPYQELIDDAIKNILVPELRQQGDANNADALKFITSDNRLTYVKVDAKSFQDTVIPVRDKYMAELEPWVQDIAKKVAAER